MLTRKITAFMSFTCMHIMKIMYTIVITKELFHSKIDLCKEFFQRVLTRFNCKQRLCLAKCVSKC